MNSNLSVYVDTISNIALLDCLKHLCSSQSVPATTPGEILDHPQSSPLVDEVPPPAVGNVSNDTELKHDESKQEMPLLPEGQQKPAVQSFPNYSYGFMLPSPGSQFMQMEGLETQAHDASLISNYAVRPWPASLYNAHPLFLIKSIDFLLKIMMFLPFFCL